MNLEQAIKELDKIFFIKKDGNLPMFIEEREKYVESIKRLYDKGYELIKRRKND